MLRHVDAERIRARKFRVALDAVNGAGSRDDAVRFLRDTLGCELHAISVDPDEAVPAHRRAAARTPWATLSEAGALESSAESDSRRIRMATGWLSSTKPGTVLDNDDVLALAVDAVLRRRPGDVVVNLTTSSVIDDVAAAHGRRVYRTPVGEANVVEMMQAVNAVIGGEGSNGGIIFPAVHLCRDSYTGMAFLLDRMAETGARCRALAARSSPLLS